MLPNTCDTFRNIYFRNLGKFIKCIVSNTCNSGSNGNFRGCLLIIYPRRREFLFTTDITVTGIIRYITTTFDHQLAIIIKCPHNGTIYRSTFYYIPCPSSLRNCKICILSIGKL